MDQFLVLVRGILSHILGKKEGHDLLTSLLHRCENIAQLRPNSDLLSIREHIVFSKVHIIMAKILSADLRLRVDI